jgi:SAM-dependent methyltransferase
LVEVFREIRRVLRPDGVVWLNLGDTYAGYHGNARVPDEDAPSNKSGYVENMRKSNVGIAGLKPKDLVGIPWRVAFALQDDGWWLRSDVIWAKNACMPEAVTDRPTKAHEYVFLLTKAPRYFYDADAVREALSDTPAAASWRRIFDPAKQSKEIALKKIGCKGGNNGVRVFNPRGRNRRSVWTVNPRPYPGAHFATWPPKLVEIMVKAGSSEKGCCPTCGAPWNRVEYRETYREQAGVRKMSKTPLNVVRAGWRQRGPERRTTGWGSGCTCEPLPPRRCVVLDPFSGSATTGAVALRLGRDYIGIDLSKKYLPLAVARLEDRKPPVEVAAQETVDLIFELFGHPGDSR